MNSKQKKTQALICTLTENEDERQDLWVNYLEAGNSLILEVMVKKLQTGTKINKIIASKLKQIPFNPDLLEISAIVDGCSELEQEIIFLLVLGLSAEDIAEHRNIPLPRLQQIISTIRSDPKWKEYAKDKTE